MSVEMPAFMVYRELLKPSERLSDAELGRLFRAMLHYAFLGEQTDLGAGREAVLLDVAQQAIDSGAAKYNKRVETNRANGKKGGRAKKAADGEQMETDVHSRPADVDSSPLQEAYSNVTPIGFMDADDAVERQQELNNILDAAQNAGFQMNQTNMTKLTDLAAETTTEIMLKAIDDCAEHGAHTMVYLRKVVDSLKAGRTKQTKTDDDWEHMEFENFK